MRCCLKLILICLIASPAFSQEQKEWSDADRRFLLSNLVSTRDAVAKETANLSAAQWNFKESPDRWNIKQVIEHIAIWELLFQREISQALASGAQPALAQQARADSVIYNFIMEETPHVSVNYTKPFTFSLPMGLNEGEHMIAWLFKMRQESIDYLHQTTDNLRLYFLKAGRPDIHQVYINVFGHTKRHLRQIRKIKQHPAYPK